jgi:hypothetical protein
MVVVVVVRQAGLGCLQEQVHRQAVVSVVG